MALERVVRIRVAENVRSQCFTFGSGYLIGPRRVLTAAHVIVAPNHKAPAAIGDQCEVLCSEGEDRWLIGQVLWVDPVLDLAVVSVDAGARLVPARCGRVEGDEPLGWSAIGYPVASLDDSGRQPEQAYGDVSPITQAPAMKLGLKINSRQARATDTKSGWAGLSGAGVLCGDRLVGVVIEDPAGYAESLVARRLLAVAGDPSFHEALGAQLVLEAVPASSDASPDLSAAHGGARTAPSNVPATVGRPLPNFTTSFVGRQGDLAEVTGLLESTALLTITGVGGVGKTRLAVQLARQLASAYTDGAWYAPLASVTEARLVMQAVASAVGSVEKVGRSLIDSLVDDLRDQHVLLLLDNCEQVVETTRELCEAVLAGCPGLVVIATSRQPLMVDGETVWQLPPLPVPPVDLPVDDMLEVDSVRLFVERAAKSNAHFVLDSSTGQAVAEICRRLDGIPLAIQLVVGMLRSVSVNELAIRLSDWFRRGRSSTTEESSRHKTMYGAIEWSFRMLDDAQKTLFARLAAFQGSCTLAAVEQVCGRGFQTGEVFDLLDELVDRSLVVADTRERTTRYRLLEPVREFAQDELDRTGENDALHSAHAKWFLAFASEAEAGIKGAEMPAWLTGLDRDENNIRKALRFLLSEGDPVDGLRLASAMEAYWICRARFTEGRSWFEEALAKGTDAPPAQRATALVRFANLIRDADRPTALHAAEDAASTALGLGDPFLIASALLELARFTSSADAARNYYEECATNAREARNTQLEAAALSGLAGILAFNGDIEGAIANQVQVLSAVRDGGDPWEIACAIAQLGLWRNFAEDFDRGLPLLIDALSRFQAMSSPWGTAWALCAIAEPAAFRGELDAAETGYREALDIFDGGGMDDNAAWALAGLGYVALLRDDLLAARTHFKDMCLIRDHVYDVAVEAASGFLPHLTALFAAEGRHHLAARLLGGADTARANGSFSALYLKDRVANDRAIETVRNALGEEESARARQQGAAEKMELLVSDALESIGARPADGHPPMPPVSKAGS